MHKILKLHLISCCGYFAETYCFCRVLDDSPGTLRKLCLSTNFPQHEIRWNFGILRSGGYWFNISQLVHDAVTTLGFGCFLVATSDNLATTLSQRCISDVVTTTNNWRCYNVVFSTSAFRSGINVAAKSGFWSRFPGKNPKVLQYHYNFVFPKICNIALRFHFLLNITYSVCINAKPSLKWKIWSSLP